MESQMVHPYGHGHDQDHHKARYPHLGDAEHHHEKKSVLKKVKAKAKKIKDTITKHGHGHNHDHDHDNVPDDHDLDEEDDEDDELMEDPEVHGAPTDGSTTVISSTATPLKKPVPSFSYETKEADPSKTFVPGTESKANLERPKGLEENHHAPKDTPYGYTPSNYQTKVTDPTGAGNEEIGVTPILRSFDKMNIHNESEPKPQQNLTNIGYSSTGGHGQFSPETPYQPIITPQHPQTLQQDNMDTVKPETQGSSLTEKISSATSSISDKALSAKNVIASKLGYGEKNERSGADPQESTSNKQSSAAEYGKKVAATVTKKLTPVYEKAAEAGTTVVSKLKGATTAATGPENEPAKSTVSSSTGQDRGVSVKDYLAEKLRPGEEDRALSEVISDALHKRKNEPETGKPMGKVTESEEVARRLETGDKRADEREQSSYVSQAGEKIVVDKVKGTVGSWLGFGGNHSRSARQQSTG